MNTRYVEEGNWPEVRAELARRLPGWRPPPSISAVSHSLSHASVAARAPRRELDGGSIVRTFWWGFHIECSSNALRAFASFANPVNDTAAAIGPVIGTAAPFVFAAATFIAGAPDLLKSLDQGHGIYISMSWFAPGVFIPTTVPARVSIAPMPRSPRLRVPDALRIRFDPGGDHSHPRPDYARANAREAVLGSGERATFPTLWGVTHAHIYNTGNSQLTFSVQAGALQPTEFSLDSGEDWPIATQWAAFPVTFTNLTRRDEANGVWPFMSVWVW